MTDVKTPVQIEEVLIADTRPHPRNYRAHPDDQLQHIMESIREHGFYRNVVLASDNTILAGHGVVQAARKMNIDRVPAIRLGIEPFSTLALKLLVGDNEISHLGEIDDRTLSEILKDIKDKDEDGLLGSGFDDKMLANLVFITRPKSEIESFDAAAHWAGLPESDTSTNELRTIVHFATKTDRDDFAKRLGVTFGDGPVQTMWWPPREKDDILSVRFKEESAA
jgi:hypothetical protein